MSKELPQNYELLSGANLAYIGDAYYELQIRKYLLECKITKSNELKNLSVKYVSAHAHHIICEKIKNENVIFTFPFFTPSSSSPSLPCPWFF